MTTAKLYKEGRRTGRAETEEAGNRDNGGDAADEKSHKKRTKRGTKETNYSDYTSSSGTFPAPSTLARSSPALDSIECDLSTLRKQRVKTAALQREAGDSRSCL